MLLSLVSTGAFSQQNISSDDLLKSAQSAIRQEKNYPKAISLLKTAISQSPDYSDLRIMLGRVYTWSDSPDSARTQFQAVLQKDPANEDALNASFDLEYWNKNLPRSLEIVDQALKHYPNSEELVLKKVKVLSALEKPQAAIDVTESFIRKNPESKEALKSLRSLKDANLKNNITYGYTFSSFDKRFAQPWHMANFSYGRVTPFATLNFQVNYANRFNTNGVEFETNSYPAITNGLYAYVGAAFSNSSIFSRHRFGVSLYKSLPLSFEAEGGVRYLKFNSATILYVVGMGRYFGNSFFGLRSYIGPGDGQFSKSFNLYSRFYLSDDRNDYFGISGGTGFSPDDRARNIDINRNLKSLKAGIEYSRNVTKRLIISGSASYLNEEYSTATFGNQFTISAGIQHRF
ncbi:YaiO family outer membrane beta-barrel protein [Flavihumibacter sp. R14]|nr:YaiO family outer membrane beta-barrel protein [Flavihumibacter soli]